MKRSYLTFALAGLLTACHHSDTTPIGQLEEELAQRDKYRAEKETRIERLKKELRTSGVSVEKQKFVYEELYEQYATYQFDSAMFAVERMTLLAEQTNDSLTTYRCQLHRIMLMATAGYFSELKEMMEGLETEKFTPELKLEYFKTAEWAYNRMGDYLGGWQYSSRYYDKGYAFQDSIMQVLPAESIEHRYYAACHQWIYGDTDSLIADFTHIAKHVSPEQRLYAQSAWALSWLYDRKEDKKQQREWLIQAAISDQKAQMKESMALQELALQLRQEGGEEARANRYLSLAISDALFYGNRLRLTEIAKKAPEVMADYPLRKKQGGTDSPMGKTTSVMLTTLLGMSTIALAVSLGLLRRRRKMMMMATNSLKHANMQLQEANDTLLGQTRLRENCMALFVELAAAYANKLNVLQQNVQRKVESRQTADLLKMLSPSRMSEQEAREFFMSFDKTFLSTFPHFIERANALMREDSRFTPSEATALNLDLRILALMRLGVKDTAKIATLLNCSQQTVYNHRSTLKSRAICKETFDFDLMGI